MRDTYVARWEWLGVAGCVAAAPAPLLGSPAVGGRRTRRAAGSSSPAVGTFPRPPAVSRGTSAAGSSWAAPSEAAPTSTPAVATPRQRRGRAVRPSAGGVASCGGPGLTTASRKNTPPSARCHSNVIQMKYTEQSAISRATE